MPNLLSVFLLFSVAASGCSGSDISGEVYYDKNANGVWDEGEQALEGVTVFIDYNRNGVQDSDEEGTVTNSDGKWSLSLERDLEYYPVSEVLPVQWSNTTAQVNPMETAASSIIGGVNASLGRFPFMVSLQSGGHSCGGALIASNWVLTAAHCVSFGAPPTRIVLGTETWNDGGFVAGIEEIYEDPGWGQAPGLANDTALIKLDESFMIRRAPLINDQQKSAGIEKAGNKVVTVGWGLTGNGQVSLQLKEAEIELVDNQTCREYHGSGVTDDMICAGEFETGIYQSACKGDSGGPLLRDVDGEWVHVGVVSWGKQGCPPNTPGVYSRTSAHLGFIYDHVKPEKAKIADAQTGDDVRFGNFR